MPYDCAMHAEDVRQARQRGRAASSYQSPTLIGRLFSFLFGSNDPEREKKRLLKEIEHALKNGKHHFYRAKTQQVLPAMAKFFYEIYTVAGPAQLLASHADSSEVLKIMVVEHAFSDRQRELHDRVAEEGIRERASQIALDELKAEVQESVTEFMASFDATQIHEINHAYDLVSTFLDLIHFDYYFLLKKFDPRIPEQDFRYSPHFETIQAEHVLDDLKDFLALIYTVDPQANWSSVLDTLKDYRAGVDIVAPGSWPKILRMLTDVRRSQIFELCVRHASGDPNLKVRPVFSNAKVAEDYLSKIKTQSELLVAKLVKQEYDETVQRYTLAVFGTTAVEGTKNYTAKSNTIFTQRMLVGYAHIAPINYLAAFLLDYFGKYIRELVDLLIVRGQWTTAATSQQLSECYHLLLEAADELEEFDRGLAEEGEVGVRLKSLVWKADRDPTAIRAVRQLLKEVNAQALAIVRRSAQNLVLMGKSLKVILEDYDSSRRELIINWKEIESLSNGTIRSKIVEAYKRIYYFIQLIQLFVAKAPA